eukprot:gene16437-biopygen21793
MSVCGIPLFSCVGRAPHRRVRAHVRHPWWVTAQSRVLLPFVGRVSRCCGTRHESCGAAAALVAVSGTLAVRGKDVPQLFLCLRSHLGMWRRTLGRAEHSGICSVWFCRDDIHSRGLLTRVPAAVLRQAGEMCVRACLRVFPDPVPLRSPVGAAGTLTHCGTTGPRRCIFGTLQVLWALYSAMRCPTGPGAPAGPPPAGKPWSALQDPRPGTRRPPAPPPLPDPRDPWARAGRGARVLG